jgi:hypothetical protein
MPPLVLNSQGDMARKSQVNGELDSVGIVIDAIEDSVGERGLAA